MSSTSTSRGSAASLVLLFVAAAIQLKGGWASYGVDWIRCMDKGCPCYGKVLRCPMECPSLRPYGYGAKRCILNCFSPKCEATCKDHRHPCHHKGAGCKDPRFIGGDGAVFYFHGRKGEHFSLISDADFQVNARFIGHRPAGRSRDFTWIQALGFMFGPHTFTVQATRAAQWDHTVDHLDFHYNGEALVLLEGHLSEWQSPDNMLRVARTNTRNGVVITIDGVVEVTMNAVPITKEDDTVHNYRLPSNDSFVHLDTRFELFKPSPNVEGVLGRTYRLDYVNTAKAGVAMPVVGGEDKYRTSSLLSPDCKMCLFSPLSTSNDQSATIAQVTSKGNME